MGCGPLPGERPVSVPGPSPRPTVLRRSEAGRHALLYALAAMAAWTRPDVPARVSRRGPEEFACRARDLESRGSDRGVTLVDVEAIDAAAVAGRRSVVGQVFGPSRLREVVQAEANAGGIAGRHSSVSALADADRISATDGHPLSTSRPRGAWVLVQAPVDGGVRARWAATLDEAISDLGRHLEPGDVRVTLGSGDVGTISDASLRRLPGHRHGR